MSVSPSEIVWRVHGSPTYDCEPHGGVCWMCAGAMTRGQHVDSFNGASFTGQNKVRRPTATHVCEPCIFICSRIAPVLGRPAKEGKKFGGSFRNYSHLWEEGWGSPSFAEGGPAGLGYINASKGDKPAIRAFLARQHESTWFAAIADSGQKHVIPWAPINGRGRTGRVLFDEQIVSVPNDQSMIDAMTALLTAGATKEEIQRGDYGARAYQLAADAVIMFEREFAGARHSAWFELAIWLAQRDEEQVQARLAAEKEAKANAKRTGKGKAENANSGGAASNTKRTSRKLKREPSETLGATTGQDEKRGEDKRDARGVGNDARKKDDGGCAQQLSLFGLG